MGARVSVLARVCAMEWVVDICLQQISFASLVLCILPRRVTSIYISIYAYICFCDTLWQLDDDEHVTI